MRNISRWQRVQNWMRLFYLNNTDNISMSGTENSSTSTGAYQFYVQWWEATKEDEKPERSHTDKTPGCRHRPWPCSNLSSVMRAAFYKTCLWSCTPRLDILHWLPTALCPHCLLLMVHQRPGSSGSCLPTPPRLPPRFLQFLKLPVPLLAPSESCPLLLSLCSLPSVRRQLKPPLPQGALPELLLISLLTLIAGPPIERPFLWLCYFLTVLLPVVLPGSGTVLVLRTLSEQKDE